MRTISTIIKLAIVAVLLHGMWRAGTSYWRYYQLDDGIRQVAQFAFRQTESEVQAKVAELAGELGVSLEPEDIQVRKSVREITVDLSYVDRVQIFPRYFYPWTYQVHVHTFLNP